MVTDTWTTIALPILEKLADFESSNPQTATSEILSECNGSEPFLRTLASLIEDEYVAGGRVFWPLEAGKPTITVDVLRITPRGRRAIRQWPAEHSVEIFVEIIERNIHLAPDDETRSKLQGLLDATRAVGTDVLAGVISNLLKSAGGM